MDKQRKKIHYKFPPYGVFYLLTNLSSPYDKCLVGTKILFFLENVPILLFLRRRERGADQGINAFLLVFIHSVRRQ